MGSEWSGEIYLVINEQTGDVVTVGSNYISAEYMILHDFKDTGYTYRIRREDVFTVIV